MQFGQRNPGPLVDSCACQGWVRPNVAMLAPVLPRPASREAWRNMWGGHRDAYRSLAAQDSVMGDRAAIALTLEVACRQEPITGTVTAPDGTRQEFSGWSELFAVLATLLGGGS
jgi:hypothetical protein